MTRAAISIVPLLLLLSSLTTAVHAQSVTLTGVVRDDASRAVPAVTIVLDPASTARRTNTDSLGRFSFANVPLGAHVLRTLRLGYRATDTTLSVVPATPITLVLQRSAVQLDTQRVIAGRTGILGTVLARGTLQPVSGARVLVQGTRYSVTTDSAGHFALPDVPPGAHTTYTKATRFIPQLLSVVVTPDAAVEVAIEMSPEGSAGMKGRAGLLAEFDARVHTAAGNGSALVPRQELTGSGEQSLLAALQLAPAFLRKGLRFNPLDPDDVCLFINGEPRPSVRLSDIRVSTVETVELYGKRADWTNSLARRWPGKSTCGSGSSGPGTRDSRSRLDSDVTIWSAVVWLRR